MNIPLNNSPYLIESRNFDLKDQNLLASEVNRSYTDTANAVNNRTISVFPVNRPLNTGESWYVTNNQRQQGLRQVYPFSDGNLTITHGINFSSVSFLKPVLGEFFDGTYWQNLPYVDVLNATNQINVKVSTTQIIITKGAGAPPAIMKGYLVLEWITNP